MTTLTATRALQYRQATIADVPRLVELGCAQLAETYAGRIAADRASLGEFIRQVLDASTCVIFVATDADRVVGMIGMALYRHLQSGVMMAGEVAWYMDPPVRGYGRALWARAERWALERGAEAVQMVAPAGNPRVGRLYERRDYRPLETSYIAPVTATMSALAIHDDVLPDFGAYVAEQRAQTFTTVEPHEGAVFHGISQTVPDTLANWIRATYPTLTPTLSFLRQSPAGQHEPHYLHTDLDMGEWTAIAYLTEEPMAGDGTTFWRWRETGCVHSLAATTPAELDEWSAWRDLAQWDPWTTVDAHPNRVVIFPASYFHSRALLENYGAGDSARLIQVVFGTGTFPPESRA